jgi:hypothetical protein
VTLSEPQRCRLIPANIARTAAAIVLSFAAGCSSNERDARPLDATPSANAVPAPSAETESAAYQGFIYGRVTTADDQIYEGRLRWGGDQEAFWNDYFDGLKKKNPWEAYAPLDGRAAHRDPIEIFGFKIGGSQPSINLERPFMTQFGHIARIEAHLGGVQVTLKSGTVVLLNRFEAGDIDDGVRVWDAERGTVDLDARQIRTIEFAPTTPAVAAPKRLHGTVRTTGGDFTGFIQWDRQDCVGSDELRGRAAEGELTLRFDTIRSITRQSGDSALVTLHDGRELLMSKGRDVGQGNRGISIDDKRYGRVAIAWGQFERVDFTAGSSGPAYGDFAPGRKLTGSVTTRSGRRISGRFVYDFDESESTDTFDTAFEGVSYTIPFAMIASIVPVGQESGSYARVILQNGDEMPLDRSGDLGDRTTGVLVFVDGQERPEYLLWNDVARIDLDPPGSGSEKRE